MSIPQQVQYAVVNSGQTLSGYVPIAGARALAVSVPAITSCGLYLQGAIAGVNSADFGRILKADGTGDFLAAVAAGNRGCRITDIAAAFRYLRFETSVAQTDVRTIAVVSRL